MSEQTIRKPTGLPIGAFKISIDDGYVEYSYSVRPEETQSIDGIHKWICRILGAKREDGEIREIKPQTLQCEIEMLRKLLREALPHIECKTRAQSGLITEIGEYLQEVKKE